MSSRSRPTPTSRTRYSRYAKEHLPKGVYCGAEGRGRPNSFPVNTPARAVAALAYARKAPYPQGIRDCVMRIASEKGWLDEEGHIHKGPRRSSSTARATKRVVRKRK